MYLVCLIVLAVNIGGLSDADVILANETGLFIARVEIDGNKFEELQQGGKILVSVTPTKHDLKIVFRGGADVDWPHFDFSGVHEIFFERLHNKIQAHVQ